jgi:hypothetical protein
MSLTAPPLIPLITEPASFAQRAQDWTLWQANEFYPALIQEALLLTLSLSATSTTSNAIGTGSKSFTVQTGLGFKPGMSLIAARTSAPTNRMWLVVVSYNSDTGALVTTSQSFEGAGTFTDWSINTSFNGVISANQIPDLVISNAKLANAYINDLTTVTAVNTDYVAIADASDSGNKKKALISDIISATLASSPSVRQTVLTGNVNTSGLPNFGGSTGSDTVTTSTTLVATAANGELDRIGTIVNPSWTGLNTNGTMYLYLDIAADGTCTTGSTTLQPTYRWGGADVTTNNQFTFNIQEMIGKVGDGSVATQTYRVFVGQVTVANSVVSAITWYALMGRYTSVNTSTLPSTTVAITSSHNIGLIPKIKRFVLINLVAEAGYEVGAEATQVVTVPGSGHASFMAPSATSTSMRVQTGNAIAFKIIPFAGGVDVSPTAANWAYRFEAERGW